MKSRLYLFLAIASSFVACKQDEDVKYSHTYVEGQQATLSINLSEGTSSNSSIRKIYGTPPTYPGDINIKWGFNKGDKTEKIAVELYKKDIPSGDPSLNREIFELTKVDETTASFVGKIPQGYNPSEGLRIIGGNITDLLPSTTSTIMMDKLGGIPNNQMRFEAIVTDLSEDITLEAAWSAFYVPLGVKLTYGGSEDEFENVYGQLFSCTITNVEIYTSTGAGENVQYTKLYTYALNKTENHNITSTTEDHFTRWLFIAAPTTYTGLKFRFYVEFSTTSAVAAVNPKEYYEFAAPANSSCTLIKNQYHLTAEMLCPIIFNLRE